MSFELGELLLNGRADAACRAVVVLPVRNEEQSLAATLDALAAQVTPDGTRLPAESFEVLLLLNNCTDGSAGVAEGWLAAHPEVRLHCLEKCLAPDEAHIGTARRLLMDTAWSRLRSAGENCAILSTDGDSYVAPDWIAQNLLAIERGADAVGGVLELICDDYRSLPTCVREAYDADKRYQMLVAEMEDRLDPQAGDPWPRHLEHFGASLGCTPEIYARAGGMPVVAALEDVGFVDRLRRVDARLRHEPKVRVMTSARLLGRVTTGLSGQLRAWLEMHEQGETQQVASAAWLEHRFCSLRGLRRYYVTGNVAELVRCDESWRDHLRRSRHHCDGVGEFLRVVDCDRWIEATFRGEREGAVGVESATIARYVEGERGLRKTMSGATFEEIEAVALAADGAERGPLGST